MSTATSTIEKHAFNAEISKVLKLVIHSLYTNKDIFLRELISNASDACEKLRYLGVTQPQLLQEAPDLKIRIAVDEKNNTLSITDNGIGMSGDDLVQNLGTIAKSGTEQFFSQLTGDAKKDASLIGQFGVGFYSAFMVAEKVVVTSRKAGEEKGYTWSSTGEGEFTIEEMTATILPRGTTVTLHLQQDAKEYLDRFRIQHIVNVYSDHIAFPIEYQEAGEDTVEVINEGSALWVRQKSDITEEQYKEFYHHVGHSADAPFLTMHNKVEGKISYTNLLFIPSLRPFDLFHPDRKRRVKLYVKRVFITDENVDLVPHYLRFLRGIIDSEDLPLNISRETLQANPLLTAIRESITKRVISELGKKAAKEPEAYAEFWGNFGSVLKEGLCEAVQNKEPLLEVCRFHSTVVEGNALTSLDDYVSRMKDGQEYIYYLTGEKLDALRKSPQLEGFRKNGIEVLLLHDHVDDFWVTVVSGYKGKKLRSVLSAGDELKSISGDAAREPDKKESGDATPASDNNAVEKLISAMRTLFGEEVQDIRATAKLTESPVCLAVSEGSMSMRMERFLIEHKQLPGASARILEINPTHPIIASLAKTVDKEGMTPEAEDTARILLDQARIIEGEELADPAGFMHRINALLSRTLAA